MVSGGNESLQDLLIGLLLSEESLVKQLTQGSAGEGLKLPSLACLFDAGHRAEITVGNTETDVTLEGL